MNYGEIGFQVLDDKVVQRDNIGPMKVCIRRKKTMFEGSTTLRMGWEWCHVNG